MNDIFAKIIGDDDETKSVNVDKMLKRAQIYTIFDKDNMALTRRSVRKNNLNRLTQKNLQSNEDDNKSCLVKKFKLIVILSYSLQLLTKKVAKQRNQLRK